ncbi:MAG TPA: hypothetical protein VHS31_19380 [Tepidisphaeraceae bacterium]|jgi:hypothetical protein|nr:hypothetical protein [Tepidisphaeraceae bacterium]
MKFTLICIVSAALLTLGLLRATFAAAPQPSPYPISWEFKFQHDLPKRIVVDIPGKDTPVAYWYLTYTVTNNTDEERAFLPLFEMVTKEGNVIHSDKAIPKKVFDTIKDHEKKQFLEPWTKVGGELRLGEDQAKDGVAIWEEPSPRMGKFSIYASGFSGEAVTLKDDDGKVMNDKDGNPIILRKTLQLNYHIRGDEVYPGEDDVNVNPEQWVMR